MVLEGAAGSGADQPYGDVPPSDDDRYNDNRQDGLQHQMHGIDASVMPKPMPVFGSLLGNNTKRSLQFTESRLKELQRVLGRTPTPEETDAIAYVSFKAVQIMSYQPPISVAAGLWRAYQTAGTYRFPFYQPKLETFNPEVFPFKSGPLRGFRAVISWHILRSVPYAISGMFFGGMLFTSYAASVSTTRVISDPRLKDFTDALRQEAMKQRKSTIPQMPGQSSSSGAQAPVSQNQNDYGDDASPTSGAWEGEASVEAKPSLPTTTSPRPWPKVRPVPIQSQAQEKQDQPFDAFDDDSPTGGRGLFEDTKTQNQPVASAWERLRRGDRPLSTSAPQTSSQSSWQEQQDATQREQRQGSTVGDSFAFSKTEEEKAFARQEAQKEFDAKVERERRGGDFSQNGGDQKRW